MGTKKKEPNYLDEEIKRVVDYISILDPTSEEYKKAVENLKVLTEAKATYETETKAKLNPNSVLAVGGNLLGIGMVLGYERLHIIASKALSFIIRPKI